MKNPLLLCAVHHSAWGLAGILILTFLILDPAFGQPEYWLTLSRQYFPVAALALVMTPIILTGGIDLSVGSITLLSAMVIGVAWHDWNCSLALAFSLGIIVGLLCGIGNGSLICLGVPPLVATLATRELYRGLAYSISLGEIIRFREALPRLWETGIWGIPVAVFGFLLLFLVTYLLVHHTWMGRMIFAMGDNEEAARFAAVPVPRLKFAIYAGAGLVAGICGSATVLHYRSASPEGATSLELLAIACVVLGGVRITGGWGSMVGTLVGILTLIMLRSGLQTVQAEWRDSITGCLLLVFALINEASARWSAHQVAAWKTPLLSP